MNSPEPTMQEVNPLNIADIRDQIDEIDAQLADLIERRCGLSASVAAAKRANGDHAFGWRPAREVEILRTVMQRQASLNPELAFSIWRALISANLAAQGELTVFAVEETLSQACQFFSVGIVPTTLSGTRDVLQALVQDDHAIGVLPWPSSSDWWVELMAPEFSSLYVCAVSPLVDDSPDVMLVCARNPEEAGEDIALVAGPIGAIEGGSISRFGVLELVACGEFISHETLLPAGCRLIGNFALA
jgi:chorismate mutase / prephenate dehydratase